MFFKNWRTEKERSGREGSALGAAVAQLAGTIRVAGAAPAAFWSPHLPAPPRPAPPALLLTNPQSLMTNPALDSRHKFLLQDLLDLRATK